MADILKDKTSKALISMSLPISIGMLSTLLFQLVDTFFVGQLGAEALAALSFSATVYGLVISIFIGISVGVSVIIGTAIGAENIIKVRKTTWIAILLSFSLSAVLSYLGIFFVEPIFIFLGAESDILPFIKEYTIPLLIGVPLLTTGFTCSGILRASGNVSKPEFLMAIAGGINLIFDYVLIFGKFGFPELGIKGAAFATIASWIFLILGMSFLLFKDKLLSFSIKGGETVKHILKEIFTLSVPTIATQMVGPIVFMYLVFLFAKESSLVVAALGVAGRLEGLLMVGIIGVSSALTPFIAQNSGANKPERIEEAMAFGGKASTYLGIFVAILLFIFIKPIAGLFSDNLYVINKTANYFYIVSFSYIFSGFYFITTSIFNGVKLPVNSLKISLVKSLVFTIPLTTIGSFFGLNGIFIALALTNVFAGIYASREMRKQLVKVDSPLARLSLIEAYKKDFENISIKRK